MTDLKLIDELLCDIKQDMGVKWAYLDRNGTSAVQEAMTRLREAWQCGEMPVITLGLANYFRGEDR